MAHQPARGRAVGGEQAAGSGAPAPARGVRNSSLNSARPTSCARTSAGAPRAVSAAATRGEGRTARGPPWRGAAEHEPAHPVGEPDRHLLGDHAAHRQAVDVGAVDAERVQQPDGVTGELRDRGDAPRRRGAPGAAVVVADAVELGGVGVDHRREDLAADGEAGDPQQRLAGALALDVQPRGGRTAADPDEGLSCTGSGLADVGAGRGPEHRVRLAAERGRRVDELAGALAEPGRVVGPPAARVRDRAGLPLLAPTPAARR